MLLSGPIKIGNGQFRIATIKMIFGLVMENLLYLYTKFRPMNMFGLEVCAVNCGHFKLAILHQADQTPGG